MTSKEAWEVFMCRVSDFTIYNYRVKATPEGVSYNGLLAESEAAFINYVKAKVEEEQNANPKSNTD